MVRAKVLCTCSSIRLRGRHDEGGRGGVRNGREKCGKARFQDQGVSVEQRGLVAQDWCAMWKTRRITVGIQRGGAQ